LGKSCKKSLAKLFKRPAKGLWVLFGSGIAVLMFPSKSPKSSSVSSVASGEPPEAPEIQRPTDHEE